MKKLLILLLIPFVVSAGIIEIHEGESIQNAVFESLNGDTVLIHDGTYFETVVLYGKTLTIGSLFVLDGDRTHIENTIISPDNFRSDTTSCFVYAYREEIEGRLVGLTLNGGTGTIWIVPNETGMTGGGVFIKFAGVSIESCRIMNSSAVYGGGIGVAFEDSINSIQSGLNLSNCTIRNCYSNAWGGGLYAAYCSLHVNNCVFDSNQCGALGGGAWVMFSVATFDSCIFSHGFGYSGAGLSYWESIYGWIKNCLFEFNGLPEGSQVGVCDLEYIRNNAMISRCVFRNNISEHPAIHSTGTRLRPVIFQGNIVENHLATVTTGTLLINDPFGEISYNIFRNNTNLHGGTIYAYQNSDVRIHHNVFEGNSSIDTTYGSVCLTASNAHPMIDTNWISGNSYQTFSMFANNYPHIDARNNWWGDASGPYHPTLNPNGLGDTLLSDSVLFIPWLTSPPDTTMPNAIDERERPEISATWHLSEAYPNPFNSSVRLVIAGFTGREFRLTLHNLLGQEIAEIAKGPITGGQIVYNAPASLASGVYFLRASDLRFMQTKKIVFLK